MCSYTSTLLLCLQYTMLKVRIKGIFTFTSTIIFGTIFDIVNQDR